MPQMRPPLSLIVPTRQRIPSLRRFLDSLAATASRPRALEVVLVVDADDQPSIDFRHPLLPLTHVVVPPGQTMGALNSAGYQSSSGEFLMLLNDDVVARTPAWDDKILARLRRFPDGIVLVHVNDTLLRDNLCVFPAVSRIFCELAGGICPPEYVRYRIDDHIEDVFNLLAFLGHRRTIYLPDVVFEHLNAVSLPGGVLEYHSLPDALEVDAPRFLKLFPSRKKLARKLLAHIEGPTAQSRDTQSQRQLDQLQDPFALRVRGRLRIESDLPTGLRLLRWARRQADLLATTWRRALTCWRSKGLPGLARSAMRFRA